VAALLAVNAMGSATVGDGPHFWAAPFETDDEFGGLGLPQPFKPEHSSLRIKGVKLKATTIGAIVTDASLTKAQAHRLSIMAHDGLARAVLPAHLPGDGDTIFSAATGAKPLADMAHFAELCHLATLVTARAVARGVFEATALPFPDAQRAWRDRFA
jgi:L-aminopeptidase/D-esterase-like protein